MSVSANSVPELAEKLLRDALEATGQRFTEQRAAVYRFLRATDQHPTADEVFTAVRGEITDISLATVYKALETLVSCGLATKLTYGDGSARYDGRTDDHCHSRCLRCGIVRDVPDHVEAVVVPPDSVGDGFTIQGYRLEVVGLCKLCRA
jgi:Fur family transcriptional regulator, peroxide stress response regulator